MDGADDDEPQARIVDMDEIFALGELVHAAFAGTEGFIEHLRQCVVGSMIAGNHPLLARLKLGDEGHGLAQAARFDDLFENLGRHAPKGST